MKRQRITIHSSLLWERLSQLIKVETAFDRALDFQTIRKLCADVPLKDLDMILQELIACRALLCSREWSEDGRMTETFTYNG